MKYKVFDVKQEEAINEFIQTPNLAFAEDMVKFHDGYVSFFYIDNPEEVAAEGQIANLSKDDQIILGSLEKAREITLITLSGEEMDYKLSQYDVTRGEKGAVDRQFSADEKRRRSKYQLDLIDARIAQLKAGTYDPMQA